MNSHAIDRITAPANRYKTIRLFLHMLLAALLFLTFTLLLLGWLTGAIAGPQTALNNDRLPYYVQNTWQPRWDNYASWQHVSNFSLLDQHARPVEATVLQGKPSFIGFFYAGCVTLCPISLEVLRELQNQIVAKNCIPPQFVLLTVTPEQDDANALANYAQRLKLPADWLMLTGQRQQMQKLTTSLMTDIDVRAANGEPLHGQRVFLLDTQARIRGIYNASSMTEMRRMAGDYERLLTAQD